MCAGSDVAVVSVGDLSAQTTIARYNLVPEADWTALADAGAVGDVLCLLHQRGGDRRPPSQSEWSWRSIPA